MAAKNFYTGTQADLASGAQNLIDIVTPAVADYGLTAGELASYTTLATSYQAALALATEPATSTRVTVSDKNDARELLRAATLDIARKITSTPTVTNGQLLALRLNPRLAPQPQPAPETAPSVSVMAVMGRLAKFRIFSANSETQRGKPPGVIGANVYTYVGDTPPTDPTQYFYQGLATRAITEVQFPNSVPSGSTVWVTCCWVGRRGQIGVGSNPISFALQGGAVTAAA